MSLGYYRRHIKMKQEAQGEILRKKYLLALILAKREWSIEFSRNSSLTFPVSLLKRHRS